MGKFYVKNGKHTLVFTAESFMDAVKIFLLNLRKKIDNLRLNEFTYVSEAGFPKNVTQYGTPQQIDEIQYLKTSSVFRELGDCEIADSLDSFFRNKEGCE